MNHLVRIRDGLLLGFVLALAACATGPQASAPTEAPARDTPAPAAAPEAKPPSTAAEVPSAIAQVPAKAVSQIVQVAGTPLEDFNLRRTEISPILLAAQKNPYATPADPGCAGVTADLQALGVLLGNDLDAPADKREPPGLLLQGAEAVGSAAVDTVRGAAEGLLPMRAWVRKLSGAEQHSKDLAAAIAAGSFRRAFLRGFAQAAGCPAAALPAPSPR